MGWRVSREHMEDNAGDLWALYKDSPTKLWQIQVEHDARPSISVNIVNQFNEFLKDAAFCYSG